MTPHGPEQLVDEAELYELFAPRRPAADDFRAGVARRIAQAQAAAQAEAQPEAQAEAQAAAQAQRGEAPDSGPNAHAHESTDINASRSKWLRRVAAILPPDLAAILLSGGKGWSAALALPVLVVAASVGAFLAGARSITRSARDAAPARAIDPRSRMAFRAGNRPLAAGRMLFVMLQCSVLIVMLGPSLFGGRHAVDIVVAVIVVSMLALTSSVRGMSRAGLLHRSTVVTLCIGLLATVFMSCFLWTRSARTIDTDSNWGFGAGAIVAWVGELSILIAYRSLVPLGRWRIALATLLGLFVLVFLPPIGTKSSESDLRAYIEHESLSVASLRAWDEVTCTVESLRAVGAPAPDLSAIRTLVREALHAGVDAHPTVWTDAARMGLLDAEDWRALSKHKLMAHRLDQLLKISGPLRVSDYDEYVLPMLLATRDVESAERAHLLARVEASWPASDEKRALSRAAICVRWFELLGCRDLVDARRADLLAILERHWVSGRDAKLFAVIGGFTSDPTMFQTSFDTSTALGVELMSRIGVPDGIDLDLLRGHLRAESQSQALWFGGLDYLSAIERATLLRVERQLLGDANPSLLEHVIHERVLISMLLIVALCWFAIRSTPPGPVDALALGERGALP